MHDWGFYADIYNSGTRLSSVQAEGRSSGRFRRRASTKSATPPFTFKVKSREGKTYLLRYDEETDEWTLQSGFDGDELIRRPSIELVAVDYALAKKAEQQVQSCEHCHPADAEIPFDWLLAEATGRRGAVEFVLTEPARCPNCKHEITEKTLVEPKD